MKVLQLVEEEDHSSAGLLDRLSKRDQEVGQVLTEISTVAFSLQGIDVQPDRHRATRVEGHTEGLEYRRGPARSITPFLRRGKPKQSLPGQSGQAIGETRVLGDLRFERDPIVLLRDLPKGPEKNRLADPSQSGNDHRLLGQTVLHPGEEDVESLELAITTNQEGRSGAGVGRIGIRASIHGAPCLSERV